MVPLTLKRIFLSYLFVSFVSAPVSAEVTEWKYVSGWDISFYSGDSSCVAYTSYEGGTDFFVGLSNLDANMMLEVTLMDKKWMSLENEKEYTVEVKFGNETPWKIDMTGVVMDDFRGLQIVTDAYSEIAGVFVDEFMRETEMKWTYEGKPLALLTMSASRIAFQEVVACAKSYKSATAEMSDPFASSGNGGALDPFAN